MPRSTLFGREGSSEPLQNARYSPHTQFLLPLCVFIIIVIVEWLKSERSWQSFVSALKGNLKLGVILTLIVWLFAWVCLFVWAAYTTVFNDHQNLAGRLRAVVNEKNELKNGLGVRDEYIKRLEEENAKLRTALQSQPAKIQQHGIGNGAVGGDLKNAPCGVQQVGGNGNKAEVNCIPPPRKIIATTMGTRINVSQSATANKFGYRTIFSVRFHRER